MRLPPAPEADLRLPLETIEARYRSRTLTWLIIALLGLGTSYDIYYAATNPGTGLTTLAIRRDVVLLVLLVFNRLGWTSVAAIGAIAIPPSVVTARILAGAALPIRTLSFLVLDVIVASLLFSERAVVIVAAVNVALVVTLGRLVPGLGLDTVVGYVAMSIVVAALLVAEIRYRQAIERARQAELRASEARKSAVVDTALDAIVAMDGAGRLVEFNPAAERTFGHRRKDVIGHPMADIIMPEADRPAHRSGLARYLAGGGGQIVDRRLEMTALRADGSLFPCEIAIAVAGQGEDAVFTAHIRDLTDRREAEARQGQLEQQLRESQKMQAIGQLAGGVAHDFNNTLQAIGGYLSFVLEEVRVRAPDLAPDLEQAEKATERAAGFVRQLLAFSRRQVLDLQVASLNDTIAAFLGLIRRAVSERIVLRFHPGSELPPVRIDPSQIQQVVLNLCLNARDAMPDRGELTLETELITISDDFARANPWARPGTFVALVVADTGTGMTPEIQSRMFEPFFSTKRSDRGTGLGLAVAYGTIQQHQGFIRVDSAPGAGTSFRIYLPVADAPAPAPELERGLKPVGGSETILIADDADAIRDVVRRTLQGAGYRVIVTSNGEEAVQQFERAPGAIDLVVLDAVMPRRSGRDAFTAMRALRPDLPGLFLSGYSADTIDPGWLAAVGAELLSKPVAPNAILQRVRRVLDQARRQDLPARR